MTAVSRRSRPFLIASIQAHMLLVLFLLLAHPASASVHMEVSADGSSVETDGCTDVNEKCMEWLLKGECKSNPGFMHLNCRRSCGICGCFDLDERCSQWSYRNKCVENEAYMYYVCKESCKACDYNEKELEKIKKERRELAHVGGDIRLVETRYGYRQKQFPGMETQIQKIVASTEEYMSQTVFAQDYKYKDVLKKCLDRNENCAYWKTQHQCESNKRYMRQQCPATCQLCDELSFQYWCPIDETEPFALPNPGDLNALFERVMTSAEFKKYKPKALSMPNPIEGSDIVDGPWLIVLEEFMTDNESDEILKLGQDIGYEQSVDTGVEQADGTFEQITSTWRTSSTAWCGGSCLSEKVITDVTQRVETVTNIPAANAEHMQFLKYQGNEFYKYHHDMTPFHSERQQGPRVLTMFFYLNTVETGGGTKFPNLNITIQPAKGKAVLWPNSLDSDPLTMDRRTAHQALPLENEETIKYAANYWIHQRDWLKVKARNCI